MGSCLYLLLDKATKVWICNATKPPQKISEINIMPCRKDEKKWKGCPYYLVKQGKRVEVEKVVEEWWIG